MEDRLLPCPLCGRKPRIIHTPYLITIRCKGGEQYISNRHLVEASSTTFDRAMEAWNTRTDLKDYREHGISKL